MKDITVDFKPWGRPTMTAPGHVIARRGEKTMTETRVPFCSKEWLASLIRIRTWHLGLLVLYVAVAIVNVQDQGRTEPILIALASAGFLAYATIGWLGWRYVQRFEARVGSMPLLVLYLIALAVLFLVATVAYLVIENLYLGGAF